MKIRLNGQIEVVREGVSIAGLIKDKGLPEKAVIVEYNGKIMESKTWGEVILKPLDSLEVLRFVGGG